MILLPIYRLFILVQLAKDTSPFYSLSSNSWYRTADIKQLIINIHIVLQADQSTHEKHLSAVNTYLEAASKHIAALTKRDNESWSMYSYLCMLVCGHTTTSLCVVIQLQAYVWLYNYKLMCGHTTTSLCVVIQLQAYVWSYNYKLMCGHTTTSLCVVIQLQAYV